MVEGAAICGLFDEKVCGSSRTTEARMAIIAYALQCDLSDEVRAVVSLRGEGLTIPRIAARLGLPRNRVKYVWENQVPILPTDTPNERRCPRCGENKPMGEFGRTPNGKPKGYCRPCDAATVGKSHKRRLAKMTAEEESAFHARKSAASAAWYRANLDRSKATKRVYSAANSDRRRAYLLCYSLTNADRIKASKDRYRRNNPEKVRAYVERYRERTGTGIALMLMRERGLRLDWEDARKLRNIVKVHSQRCRVHHADCITVLEWVDMKLACDRRCLGCGRQEPEIKLTVDHIVAAFNGGGNTADNIQPLCQRCNTSKGTKVIDYRPDNWPWRAA